MDTAAVRFAAERFDAAADLLGGQLSGLRFDGSVAGHAHVAHGDVVRATLERLAAVTQMASSSVRRTVGANAGHKV